METIMENFWCVVLVKNKQLFYTPLFANGYYDKNDFIEITDPVSQDFLDDVNEIYKTDFQMKDFL